MLHENPSLPDAGAAASHARIRFAAASDAAGIAAIYAPNVVESAISFPGLSINGFVNASNVGIAFVKLKSGQSISEAELKKFIGERLNKLEMPREIIFKDQLPKTLIGKLSKKELREEYQAMKGKKSEPA